MTTADIRQKLHQYIDVAEEKKIMAIFSMVEDEIEEPLSPWNDIAFVEEIEKRTNEMETGKVKTYSWEEVQLRATQSLDKARNKKNV